MDDYQDKFEAIAKSVLADYALDEPRLSFIRQSDSVTYKVTTANSEPYLLRIHIPITSAMGGFNERYQTDPAKANSQSLRSTGNHIILGSWFTGQLHFVELG